ncbi:MAG: alanine dehydrogenase [Chloroflexi bacterium]|nr:alanine dehydrogenase [Chloroflexota bacterium]
MIVGVPKEIMDQEYRVSITPQVCGLLAQQGIQVLVQEGAGGGAGFADAQYQEQGARLAPTAAQVWSEAQMIVKVKQPLLPEYPYLRPGLLLYCFLHLAAEPELTGLLLERQVSAIAAETIQTPDGALPVLAPMSEIAGKMTVQVSAHYLSKPAGGVGRLLSGVVGVPPVKVLVVGGGTVGTAAARMALGLGAEVTVLDRSHRRLVYLQEALHGSLVTMLANDVALTELIPETDVLIGAVLVPGARTPQVVSRAMVARMKPGAVIIDVSIDQGGCIETSRPTHHSNPTYTVDGVIHYCVVNMPGAVPQTSSRAYAASSYPYVALLAAEGLERAVADQAIALGVNTHHGYITCPGVASALGQQLTPLGKLLRAAA